jgi:predicted HAD superfamily hydrolase
MFSPSEHSICRTWPQRLVAPGAWVEHIPFAMYLIETVRPRLFVELGTHSGNSYCSVCQAVKELGIDAKCFAVDTWCGDAHAGYYGANVLRDLREHHDPLYQSFSTLLQTTFDDACPSFQDGSIDLLHIDGLHTYEAVRHDFESWLPKLSPRSVVIMHDTNVHENGFGVWKLWDELEARYPAFEFLHGHGLGVLGVGPECPKALDAILKTPTEVPGIRAFFEELGAHLGNALTAQTASDEIALRDRIIQTLTSEIGKRNDAIQTLTTRMTEREREVRDVMLQVNSKAWKTMLMLRKARVLAAPPNSRRDRVLRKCAKFALARYRAAKRVGSSNGNGKVRGLASGTSAEKVQPSDSPAASGKSPCLVNIEGVEPCASSPGRIAVHLHVFYPEMAPEFAGYLRNMPFAYDLYVSTPDQEARAACKKAFSGLPLCEKTKIEVVPNRGRDVAPIFCAFGKELSHYDFIAHLHSKKSGHNQDATLGWREYLCTELFGNRRRIQQIFTLLSAVDPAGIVYPQTYARMPSWAHTWLANRHQGATWCRRLGIERVPRGYFDYPVGSMFWARGDALNALFAAGISLEDFPDEAGQLDGTLAHCIERLLVLVTRQHGFRHAVIEDADSRNWSAWRLDHYFSRTQTAAEAYFANPKIRAIAFDVFDTLLSRPLLDPEANKEIVAQRAGEGIGDLYRQHRCTAEAAARQQAGRDVGLDQIYPELAKQCNLSQQQADSLRCLEEEVEWHSVTPRDDGAALLRSARRTGKRVILISDMFLPKDFLERLLKQHGIVDWDALYVSNDVGVRKDSGELYRRVLEHEGLSPAETLMVGDNERSDVQIPVGLGMPTYHVLRSVEIARSLPRLTPLVEAAERDRDLNNQLTMGLIVQRAYSPLFYDKFDPASLFPPTPNNLGYNVVGPLVLGFVSWLAEQAQRDLIDRLYFLAREGQSIKLAYDRWVDAFGGPPSEYLVLSRRAATVPAIESHKDILSIARTNYSTNEAKSFLNQRFGLELSRKRWDEIHRQTGWLPTRQLAIGNNQIKQDVLQLLDAVREDIFAQAAVERPSLQAYLHEIGLDRMQRAAIVDVGYSATVQDRVSLLTNRPLHGYYMMTATQAHVVADRHGSLVRGCFAENVKNDLTAPAIHRNSFTLEKLLGSNDGQVVRYVPQGNGRVTGVHRPLGPREQQGNQTRSDIRQGMLEYVDDAIRLRKDLYPAFCPPVHLPQEIFLAFVGALSPAENDVLETLLLDDFYCGHGLL